ncbi:MAG TPA: trypsin-like peptidase domain-containing protein [Bryobacteraceae bacterium]|nr:trypsin-like peptidase domain-containing protein [Bryobacteraceae bacterium]
MGPRRLLICGLVAGALYGQNVPPVVSPVRALDLTLPRAIPEAVRNAPFAQPFSAGILSRAELVRKRRGPLVQFGVRRIVSRDVWENPLISNGPDGRTILTAAIQSPGARGIRLHFRNFAAGVGEVWVFAPGDRTATGPYTGFGIFGNGDFWAGAVESDTAVVAYQAPAGEAPVHFPFVLDALSHAFAQATAGTPADSAAPCNLDVTCYPAYKKAATAVVEYEFIAEDGGMYACSGAMINTRGGSFKPYLLTAHHCIGSDAEAKTIQAHFLDQTAECNGAPPDRSSLPTVLGGTYLAGAPIPSGDYALVRLNGVPGGVTFLGWSSSLDAGAAVTGLHHPRASYTRIAFGNRGADFDVQVGTDTAPAALYYTVNWSSGLTEPGSSGSPLLDAQGEIVGTLTGAATPPAGENICDIQPFSVYGRFSTAYAGLRAYLEDAPAQGAAVTAASSSGTAGAPGPSITPGGFANAASYVGGIAPGSLLAIFGKNLAPVQTQAASVPLPTQVSGVSVAINGIAAPLYYVSPGQLNVQVPFEVAPGIAQVTVTANGKSGSAAVAVVPVAPGIFTDGVRPVPFGGARRGDSVMLFVTGQGPLTSTPATGAAPAAGTPVAQLPAILEQTTVTIGGVPATVQFAGIPAGLVGVAQINFQVPANAALGDQPLVVTVGGQASQTVLFTVY